MFAVIVGRPRVVGAAPHQPCAAGREEGPMPASEGDETDVSQQDAESSSMRMNLSVLVCANLLHNIIRPKLA